MKTKILGVILATAILFEVAAEIPLTAFAEKIADIIYPAYKIAETNSSDVVTVDDEISGSTTIVVGSTIVNVTTVEEFQSEHDYRSYEDITWVYTNPTAADSITITFSEDTETEWSYDCIYIYDGNDALIGSYSGSELSGQSITVEGNIIKVRLTSDGSYECYGFRVISIDVATSTGPITNLKRQSKDKHSVTLSFPAPKNATSVKIEQSLDGSVWTIAQTEALTAESTTATVTGLEMETEYYFRLNVVGGEREGISNTVTVKTDGNYTSEDDFTFNNGVIGSYTGKDTEVRIPPEVNGVPVTEIDYGAFEYSDVTKVVIPEGVQVIGSNAFYYCQSLKEVNIPQTLTEIESSAFYGCAELEAITIPDSVTYMGSAVFGYCSKLKSIKLPEGIDSIGSRLFMSCASLTEVEIPDSVTSIGSEAFRWCSLIESLDIPSGVRDIGHSAFFACSSLKSIELPEGITDIEYSTFNYCQSLAEIEIPSTVTYISTAAFKGCSGISSIVIPSGVTTIENEAFSDCTLLSEVSLPDGLKSIGKDILSGTGYEKNEANWESGLFYAGKYLLGSDSEYEGTITVRTGTTMIADYALATDASSIILSDGIKTIGSYAFSGCDNLTEITIPSSVTLIKSYPFDKCTNLKKIYWNAANAASSSNNSPFVINRNDVAAEENAVEVIFGDSVETLPDYIFYKCTQLTEITLPKNLSQIPAYAFSDCTSLAKVNMSDSVRVIGRMAFYRCTALESFEGFENITEIGDSAFSDSGIKEVTVSESMNTIGSYVFRDCEKLEKVYWNAANVTLSNIFDNAGYETTEGISAVFGENTEVVPANIFYDSNLTKVEYKGSISEIGKNAFQGTSLESIILPEGLEKIGDYAFSGCVLPEELILPDTLSYIGYGAFSSCMRIKEVTIHENISYVGGGAFSGCYALENVYWNTPLISSVSEYGSIFASAGWECENGLSVSFGDSVLKVPTYLLTNARYLKNVHIGSGVKEIGDAAFKSCKGLEKIELPQNVSIIGKWAFQECMNLCELDLGGAEIIGTKAFYNCSALTELTLPESVTELWDEAFQDCRSIEVIYWNARGAELKNSYINRKPIFLNVGADTQDGFEVVFGDTVQYISPDAFKDNPYIKKVTILDGVKRIGYSSFENCENLTSVKIGNGVTEISNDAFMGCSSLSELQMGSGIEIIEDYAFNGIPVTEITIPEPADSIGSYAFGDCHNLKRINWNGKNVSEVSYFAFKNSGMNADGGISVIFGDSVEVIPGGAINCDYVTSIVVSDNVKEIKDLAFAYCPSLKEVTIGKGLNTFGERVFYHCTMLEKVNWNAEELIRLGEDSFKNVGIDVENGFTVVFGDSVRVVPEILMGITNLKKVQIGSNVEKIGDNAFKDTNLTKITLPESVKYIGESAFSSEALTEINIPEDVTYIGEAAFAGSSVTEMTLPEGITTVNIGTFQNSKIKSVTLSENVSYIGDYAFADSELSDINLSDNITNVGTYAFQNSYITNVSLNSLSYLGAGAFENCDSLKSASINGKLFSMEREIFYDCDALEAVNIGGGVVQIGDSDFEDCDKLTTVTGCTNVRVISDDAFRNSNIAAINLPKCEILNSYTFANCTNLSKVTFSPNISDLGSRSFRGCTSLKSIKVTEFTPTMYSEVECEDYTWAEWHYEEDKFTISGAELAYPGNVFLMNKGYDYPVRWESSNEKVAKVSGGVVTCVGKGKATIKATFGRRTGYDPVREIYHQLVVTTTTLDISASSYSVVPDDTVVVYARLSSDDYTGEDAVWTTRNAAVAKIESTGFIDNGDNVYTIYAVVAGKMPGGTTVNVEVGEVSDSVGITVEDESKKYCKYIVEDEETREPIAGAAISVGGISKTTGTDGSVSYEKKDFKNNFFVPVSVSAEGYVDKNYRVSVYEDGVSYVSMKKKDGKISIEDVQLTFKNGTVRDLKDPKTNVVFAEDINYPSTVSVSVDWGDNDEGKVYFVANDQRTEFSGSITKDFGMEYKKGRTFSIYAETYDKDGKVISTSQSLPISVMKLQNSFLPKTDGKISMKQVPFFEENTITPTFGKVLQNVHINNNVLKVKIGGGESFFKIFNGKELDAEVMGNFQIPMDNLGCGEWSGTLHASVDYIKLLDGDKNGTLPIGPVIIPVVISYEAGGSVNGDIGGTGRLDKLRFTGRLGVDFGIEVFGGIGAEIEDTGAKIGIYGEGKGELDYKFDCDNGEFDPSVGIEIGAMASAKIFKLGGEVKYDVLNVTYDKNGWSGTAFGGSQQLFSMRPRENYYTTVGRTYLEEDSGFVANYGVALMSAELTNKNKTKIYQNSISVADAKLAEINGSKYIFFTVDDINRDEVNGLKLVYSVQDSTGMWSEPAAIEEDGTLDTDMNVSGKYIIWEDTNTVFNEGSDDLANYMLKTDITAARVNADGSIDTYSITNDSVYDCAPVVKETKNGAVAAWIANSAGDVMRLNGENDICYSIFDGNAWSEVNVIENVGAVGNPRIEVNNGDVYIFYSKSGELHAYSINDRSDTVLVNGIRKYTVASIGDNVSLAYFNVDNELYFNEDIIGGADDEKITIDTRNLNTTEHPVIVSDGGVIYIIWLGRNNGYNSLAGVRYENGIWSEDIQFISEEKDIKEPSIIINDDSSFTLCYYSETNTVNPDTTVTVSDCNLYVCDVVPSHNIRLGNVTYDDTYYKENGAVKATVEVENIGELPIPRYKVSILDGDMVISELEITETLNAGSTKISEIEFEFNNRSTVKNFDVKVTASNVTDFDISNNEGALNVGSYDIVIEDAYVTEERDRTYLNVLLVNEGSLKISSAEIKVHDTSENGEILYTLTTDYLEPREGQLSKIDITDLDGAIMTFYTIASVNGDCDTTDNMSVATMMEYTPVEGTNGSVTVKEGAVNQNGDAIDECKTDEISKISFNIESGDFDAVFYAGCYDNDGTLLKVYEKNESLSEEVTSVSIDTPKIPSDTSWINIFVWENNTMVPLGSKTTLKLKEKSNVQISNANKYSDKVSAVIKSNKDIDTDVYVIVYDSDMTLLSVDVQQISLTKDVDFNYTANLKADGKTVICIWESGTMKPICGKFEF